MDCPLYLCIIKKGRPARQGKIADAMANKIKTSGMGGSRNGKSRTVRTEILKKVSKKARRAAGKKETKAQD